MSKTCQHSSCSRPIFSKCQNHCHLDVCRQHFHFHGNLFLLQFEKTLNNTSQSIVEIFKSIDDISQQMNDQYREQMIQINQFYSKKLSLIKQQSTLAVTTQDLLVRKRQQLADVKNGHGTLHQYDIEQMKLYSKIIRHILDEQQQHQGENEESKNDVVDLPTIVEDESSSSEPSDGNVNESFSSPSHSNDEEEEIFVPGRYRRSSTKKNFKEEIRLLHDQCPLTRLGIYGLNEKHNIRLCSIQNPKAPCLLIHHFHRYHHLTWSNAYKLCRAIIEKSDPITTRLFPSDAIIIDQRFTVIQCPLNQIPVADTGTITCQCRLMKNTLRTHLQGKHHLTSIAIEKIMNTIQIQGQLHLDKDDFSKTKKNKTKKAIV